jgi:hypothetical protein
MVPLTPQPEDLAISRCQFAPEKTTLQTSGEGGIAPIEGLNRQLPDSLLDRHEGNSEPLRSCCPRIWGGMPIFAEKAGFFSELLRSGSLVGFIKHLWLTLLPA